MVRVYLPKFLKMEPIKLALFASGTGSNVFNILTHFSSDDTVKVDCIVSNKQDAGALQHGRNAKIDTFYHSKGQLENGLVLEQMKNRAIDFIILAGFLLKIPKEMIAAFPNKIINVHPALLPNYGGKGMYGMNVHRAVIANKEQKSGITIHLVNEVYDAGKIIEQHTTAINKQDTAESLAKKISILEKTYFPKAIETYIKKTKQ